jgi:SulP family sulfate permease
VFTIAIGLINLKTLFSIRQESPGEFTLAVFTAAAVVLIGVEHGILVAVALSLLRHVRHSYQPHTMILVPSEGGIWAPVPAAPGLQTAPGLIVYRFGADLFYANDHFFVDDVRSLVDHAPSPVRWLVIDSGAITDLDYSAARSVGELCETLKQNGVDVIFARVNQYLRSDMDRHGITPIVGANRIFSTLHEALLVAGVEQPGTHKEAS